MGTAIRKTRSFSLDPELLSEIDRTKGRSSASERVNQLLKWGLEMEAKAKLREEAAEFFSSEPEERQARQAFQRASLKSWSRDK